MDHVLQRVIDLAVFPDGHRIFAGEIGDGMNGGVSRIEELSIGNGTPR